MSLPDLTQLTLLAIEAARCGDAHTLALALDAGVAVDTRTAAGETLLILASRAGHAEAVRLLRARGLSGQPGHARPPAAVAPTPAAPTPADGRRTIDAHHE